MTSLSTSEAPALVIGAGFAEADSRLITDTLDHLVPYLMDDYCVSGGIATAAQLARAGAQTGERTFNDIDVVVPYLMFVEGVRGAFEISKFNPRDPVDDFHVGLIDMLTGVKVDVFGCKRFPPTTEQAAMGELNAPIRTAPNLGALLLSAIDRRIQTGMEKIPKQFKDVAALMAITDMAEIEQNWNSFPRTSVISVTAREAWDNVQAYMATKLG